MSSIDREIHEETERRRKRTGETYLTAYAEVMAERRRGEPTKAPSQPVAAKVIPLSASRGRVDGAEVGEVVLGALRQLYLSHALAPQAHIDGWQIRSKSPNRRAVVESRKRVAEGLAKLCKGTRFERDAKNVAASGGAEDDVDRFAVALITSTAATPALVQHVLKRIGVSDLPDGGSAYKRIVSQLSLGPEAA